MDSRFRDWAAANLTSASLGSYLSGLRALEAAYGDLDTAHVADGFAAIFRDLGYSAADERAGRPNPSRVPITRNLARTLSNLRSHLRFYQGFRDSTEGAPDLSDADATAAETPSAGDVSAVVTDPPVLSLERDLERALRANLAQIEPGLELADGGAQRAVPSGRIDILARDAAGRLVVIELKAVRAPRDAVAQVLAYMGDLQADGGEGAGVRGVLVAPDFDPRAISAARMVPALVLKRFSFQFSFETVGPGP